MRSLNRLYSERARIYGKVSDPYLLERLRCKKYATCHLFRESRAEVDGEIQLGDGGVHRHHQHHPHQPHQQVHCAVALVSLGPPTYLK